MELRLLWEIFRDRYKILLLFIALSIVGGVFLVIIMPTIYESTASIQVKRGSESALFIKDIPKETGALIFVDADNILGSLEFFMKNESLVQGVIEKCDLQDVVNFAPKKFSDPGLLSILFRKRGVAIEAEKDTEVFTIKGLSVDLKGAQRIANTFVREFFAYYAARRMEDLQGARGSYEKKAQDMKLTLDNVEKEELEYKKKYSVLDISLQKTNLLDQIKVMNDESYELRSNLRERRNVYKEVLKVIAKNPEYYKASENIAKNEMIDYYKKEIAGQEALYAGRRVELTEDHPDIVTIKEKIDSLNNLLRGEKERIFATTVTTRNSYYDSLIEKRENQALEITKIKSNLKANEDRTKDLDRKLQQMLDLERSLTDLKRKKVNLESTYNKLDEAIKLLAAAESIDMNNFLLINRAVVTGKPRDYVYMPKVQLILALLLILGIFSALVVIFSLEYIEGAPRLFETFAGVIDKGRCISIDGHKGMTLLMAQMPRSDKATAIAVWERMKKKKPVFTEGLARAARRAQERPAIVSVRENDEETTGMEHSLAISAEEIMQRKDDLLTELTEEGYSQVIIYFPPSFLSSNCYLALGQFDVLLYVVHKGEVPLRDIQADMNFFCDQGWQDKLIGVFYAQKDPVSSVLPWKK
jgi:uncharacterized protein involved in exopolysaccharide biosynthesis